MRGHRYRAELLAHTAAQPHRRPNDAAVDRRGRFRFTTMDTAGLSDPATGVLYRHGTIWAACWAAGTITRIRPDRLAGDLFGCHVDVTGLPPVPFASALPC